jgi:hypothetical protein
MKPIKSPEVNSSQNVLFIVALIAVGVALLNGVITLVKISDFKDSLEGYVVDTDSGTVNITISTSLDINLSRNRTINWGAGIVNISGGWLNATLYTRGMDVPSISLGGNWSCDNCNGFLLENIGTTNCTQLNITTGKTAVLFFNGASGLHQAYQWNVSNNDSNACSGGVTLSQWYDATANANTTICTNFSGNPSYNAINVDFLLAVPYDAQNVGAIGDTVTFTCWA